jgi:glycosyltransferase involved in cell wall biosynthesis
LPLGADFDGAPRVTMRTAAISPTPRFLCVGILEPRKNQEFLLGVCEDLWREGRSFELHIIGRVNPRFGRPVVERIRTVGRRFPGLKYHAAAADNTVAELYSTAWATVFPTIAEGCGLPLLESLWRGVPCVCSDLPVLRENADDGGCVAVAVNDRRAWADALRRVLTDNAWRNELGTAATSRSLPTWAETARILRAGLQL